MPKTFILNINNEFNLQGPIGQFIEHADNIGTPPKTKKKKK